MKTYTDPIRGWTISESPVSKKPQLDTVLSWGAVLLIASLIAGAIGLGTKSPAPTQAPSQTNGAPCQPHPAAGPDGRLAETCESAGDARNLRTRGDQQLWAAIP
jgi:hypothetical protein